MLLLNITHKIITNSLFQILKLLIIESLYYIFINVIFINYGDIINIIIYLRYSAVKYYIIYCNSISPYLQTISPIGAIHKALEVGIGWGW